MPVYDLSELHDRLALMLSQPDAKRMKSVAYLIEKNYGPKALDEVRKEYMQKSLDDFGNMGGQKSMLSTNPTTLLQYYPPHTNMKGQLTEVAQ